MKNGSTTLRESLTVSPDGQTPTATYTIYRGDQIVANGIAIFEKTSVALHAVPNAILGTAAFPYSNPHAAEIRIRASLRDLGFGRIVISTSRSSAVRKFISRSTENPASR
jgi:hypothetical protein